MAVVLALPKLYADVTARFTADGRSSVAQPFGWREPARQPGGVERIVWVPGDDESGDLGKLEGAHFPGRNPRPLGTLYELFTCRISAQDATAPTDEALQYRATRLLFDEWFRAVYLAAHGQFEILKAKWVIEKTQHRYGAAIRVLGAIQAMIPDYTLTGAPVDSHASITVVELSQTDPPFNAP